MNQTRDVSREQIEASTDAELADRLAALRKRYFDPRHWCGMYPPPQLAELHAIGDELRRREGLKSSETRGGHG